MCPDLRYTHRADKYARYRWDYAPEAVELISRASGLSTPSCVADIGSGTGILTRHLVKCARTVYAVEPDPSMRQWAEQTLAGAPSFVSINGCAEATTLPDACIDLITVGQALHWFDPQPARREFQRILKTEGWVAILWNEGKDAALAQALAGIRTAQNGWDLTLPSNRPPPKPFDYYLDDATIQRLSIPYENQDTWEVFLGALCSDSHAPDEGDHRYGNLCRAARDVFESFSDGHTVTIRYTTELVLGKLLRSET